METSIGKNKNNNKIAAIVLNAPQLDVEIKEGFVICADGGSDIADRAPDVLVGDLDSIKNPFEGANKIVCPVEKDYTDGERAVEYAAEQGFDGVTIYGIKGGRADHCYANLSLLKFARTLGVEATAVTKDETIYYKDKTDGTVSFDCSVGQTISVLPYEDAIVENSFGLYYSYEHLFLERFRARGISNITTEEKCGFTVTKGAVLVFINKIIPEGVT